jgi:hypothetical protein
LFLIPEVWLRANRRAFYFGMIGPAICLVIGGALVLFGDLSGIAWARGVGLAIAAFAGVLLLLLGWQVLRPRVARQGNSLLLYLRPGTAIRVPLEFVEGFLLGQGPSFLRADQPDATIASTIVIRIADRAKDYAQRDVHSALGSWCNHYVTIRGVWCEPLSLEVVNRLNATLDKAQKERLQESRSR